MWLFITPFLAHVWERGEEGGGPGNEPTLLPKETSFISGLKMTWLLLILLTIYTWLTYSCPHTTAPSNSTSLCDPSEEQWLT